MNAINLPLSPTPYEVHPEDTMLGIIWLSVIPLFFILENTQWHVNSDLKYFPLFTEENEVRTMVDPNSKNDRKLQELMKVCIFGFFLTLGSAL